MTKCFIHLSTTSFEYRNLKQKYQTLFAIPIGRKTIFFWQIKVPLIAILLASCLRTIPETSKPNCYINFRSGENDQSHYPHYTVLPTLSINTPLTSSTFPRRASRSCTSFPLPFPPADTLLYFHTTTEHYCHQPFHASYLATAQPQHTLTIRQSLFRKIIFFSTEFTNKPRFLVQRRITNEWNINVL